MKLLSFIIIFIFGQSILAQTAGTKKWEFLTGGEITSSPAIGSDGTIYVGSYNSKLYAVNPDGTKRWEFLTGSYIRTSPVIGPDNIIYIGSDDKKFYAINKDGTKKWEFITNTEVTFSPTIGDDGIIYLVANTSYLYAINPDGSILWEYVTPIPPGYSTRPSILSSPAIAPDGTIYISTGGGLTALYPDGSLKWRNESTHYGSSALAIDKNGRIYLGGRNDNLYAINPDGSKEWVFEVPHSLTSSPSLGPDGTIYIGCWDDRLYAVNPNGTLKWYFQTNMDIISSPAIGADGTIYVGSYDHKLYAINPDGTKKWEFETGSYIKASPAIGEDGTIYIGSYDIGSYDNRLYAIYGESGGLSDSFWPKYLSNNRNNSSRYNENCPRVVLSTHYIFVPSGEVTLDGSLSYDPNGDELSYLWKIIEKPADSPILLTDSTSAVITVEIPAGIRGQYKFSLNITDNLDGQSSDLIIVNTEKKWEFETGRLIKTSPAIDDDGTIYFGSYDKNFYALNPDGTLKWKYFINWTIDSSPAIGSDGTIYFGCFHALYALNKDGTFKWKINLGGTNSVYSSPAIGPNGTIYIGCEDYKFFAISSNGQKKWEFYAGKYVRSSPAVAQDGTIYVGSDAKKLYAFSPDGEKKWEFVVGRAISSSPAIGKDGTIYVGGEDNKLYAINPDGTKKWELDTKSVVTSSPTIGNDSTIYVALWDTALLYAVSLEGKIRWEFDFGQGNSIKSSPTVGENGTIFIGSYEGILYAINPDGNLKWRFKADDRIRSSPALGKDGTVYFGSYDKKFYAIHSESKGLANSAWPKFRHDSRNTGNFLMITSIEEREWIKTPQNFDLFPAYPNPFNPVTRIKFTLPKSSHVDVLVYNIRGQLVSRLLNENKKAGIYLISWNASNMPSGMYFIRIKAGNFLKTRKCILVK